MLTDGGRTGKYQVIPRHLGEGAGDIDLSFNDGHFGFVEHRRQHVFQSAVSRGGKLRHLDHGTVARSECRSNRYQGQLNWVVPGHHNTNDPQRLVDDFIRCRRKQHIYMTTGWTHPFAHVFNHVVERLHRRHDFCNQGVPLSPATEVFIHGFDQ